MLRGREQEIENFAKNKKYFESLLIDYTTKIVAQCSVYEIPYVIVDTNNKTEDEVFTMALAEIRKIIK
jgi:deoxyadenosine/deoxycytidine kinase